MNTLVRRNIDAAVQSGTEKACYVAHDCGRVRRGGCLRVDTENKHAYCVYPWSGTWFRCSDRYLEESFGDPHRRHLALVFYKVRGAKVDIVLCEWVAGRR